MYGSSPQEISESRADVLDRLRVVFRRFKSRAYLRRVRVMSHDVRQVEACEFLFGFRFADVYGNPVADHGVFFGPRDPVWADDHPERRPLHPHVPREFSHLCPRHGSSVVLGVPERRRVFGSHADIRGFWFFRAVFDREASPRAFRVGSQSPQEHFFGSPVWHRRVFSGQACGAVCLQPQYSFDMRVCFLFSHVRNQ